MLKKAVWPSSKCHRTVYREAGSKIRIVSTQNIWTFSEFWIKFQQVKEIFYVL